MTLADVAEVSGLSTSAVSMILNDRPGSRLSEDARQKVKAAAEALGYRPNIAARSLRTATTQTLGFISDVVATTRYASGLIRGTLEAAEELEHVVLVAETGGDEAREASAISAMLDRQVDGLIFASMRARQLSLPKLPANLPVVLLNGTSENHSRSVLPNEFQGGHLAVETLLNAGHRDRIVILGSNRLEISNNPFQSETVESRFLGIRDALSQADVDFMDEERFDLWEPKEGYLATKRVLRRSLRPTALLCMNDRIAFGAYQALAEEGLRVPEDLSVVSFDNDELAMYLRPGLTTVALPHESMGNRAVQMLLTDSKEGRSLVDMPLVVRGSVAMLTR